MSSEELIGIVVLATREVESALESQFNATGRGLHTKTQSVEHLLPVHLVKKLRFIATVRNQVVHQHDTTIDNIPDFRNAVNDALIELRKVSRFNTPPMDTDSVQKNSIVDEHKSMSSSEGHRALFIYITILCVSLYIIHTVVLS